MPKYKDLTGQKFGKLTVIKRDLEHTGGAAYWICQCECGNIKSIRGSNLTTSNKPTQSCGCLNKEINSKRIDITSQVGKKYGRLIVLERDLDKPIGHGQDSFWKCQCECGNLTSVRLSLLTSGKTRSCGCLRSEILSKSNTIDITGQKFNMLVAIERTNQKSSKNDWLWLCKCECGNEILIPTNSLTSGHICSCGCLTTSIGEYYISNILKENDIRYVREYIFKDLKSDKNGYLRFDFAILDDNNNPIRLIEFDGEQHHNQNSIYYSNQLIQNDNLKNNYCKEHNIPLTRIPYKALNNLSLELILGDEYLI